MHADHEFEEHPEWLLDSAIRGDLPLGDRKELERHLASCADCAAEIEGARMLRTSVTPGKQDDARNSAAVERALARLQEPEPFLGRLRRWIGFRRWLRPATAFSVLGASAAVLLGFTLLHAPRPPAPSVATTPPPRLLLLNDGSEITPVDATTEVQLAEQTPDHTTVRLPSGGAQFRIHHDSRRRFRVDTGPILIEDIGTVFRVDHQTGGRIRVAVLEGRIAVLYPANHSRVELGAGEDRVFPAAPEPVLASEPAKEALHAPEPAALPAEARTSSRSRAVDDPAGLLQAADLARRSHRPQAAVAPLRRLLDHYPKDPRAPSAAFTLGWVLLTDLGRTREAAAAFAETERIAPRGALAEDAAARVAEAWQKAGDSRRAAAAARHYEQTYPTGRYTGLMRGLVGEQ